MCGIAGIYRFGAAPPGDALLAHDRSRVARMLEAIRHRGPDDGGLTAASRATLGVRRLSILDVEAGHQPLSDASGLVWACQNGEIYNFPALRAALASHHIFRTRTDTEILPALYLDRGTQAVESLRGMFACAIHDRRDDTLLLARDPLGVKPLYYARTTDELIFASEIKALLTDAGVSRELDDDAIALYFALGFIPGSATPFRSIRRVRPGCRLIATPFGVRLERYWNWPAFDPEPAGHDPARAAEEGARLIGDSAHAMLLSDVPVGLLLSGGIDSSLLAALLPEQERRELRTFTVGFSNAGRHDERAYAREVARILGTRHREFEVPLDVATELPRVVRFLDEPCADPAAVPAHVVARAAASEVKVLLSGTGADEVFGGYRRYRLGDLLRRLRWMPHALAARGASALGELPLHRSSDMAERAVWLRKLLEARGRGDFLGAYLSLFEPGSPSRWRGALGSRRPSGSPSDAIRGALHDELGGIPRTTSGIAFAFDHLFYLPDDLLLKEDRTTMGASVEGRVPYLDPAIVEFAARLPVSWRGCGPESKPVLRSIARRFLPPSLSERPKHGFSVPIEDWLRGPLDDLLGDVLSSSASGVLVCEHVLRWHDEHRRGHDRSGPLWAALCFELWWREVGSAGSVATSAPLAAR